MYQRPQQQRTASTTERRERVLIAAEEVFMQRSYDDVSIDDIAERADVAHGSPFQYFGSKRGLYLAVLERFGERVRARFALNHEPDPNAWLRSEIDILLESAVEGARAFIAVVRIGAGADAAQVLARTRDAQGERILRKLAPERESVLLQCAVQAWVSYADELVAGWLETPSGTPAQIREILVTTLNASLAYVAQVQSPPGFDPQRFTRP